MYVESNYLNGYTKQTNISQTYFEPDELYLTN